MKPNNFALSHLTTHLIQDDLDPAFTQQTSPFIIKEKTTNYNDPIIHFVNNILFDAIQKKASDIHIEPYESLCRIRYRRDGILYEITTAPTNLATRLVTRLKVMANLDTSERRLPQDGRFQLNLSSSQTIDVRINTCPTLFGEKIVLRLLDENRLSVQLNALGMTTCQQTLFLQHLLKPQGMILITGPTGSGKTVTLYTALRHLNTTEKNISTIEDPIEIQLHGINQININSKIGLDFSTLLRNLLRQDPDIIMVGEIRDANTAKIALQAAQTGHLILSTVHSNGAAETITRLQSMGVSSSDLMHSLSLIIAQRLIRKLCPHCKTKVTPPNHSFGEITEIPFIYEATGCEHCFHGYCGRVGIYEFLPVTEHTLQQTLSSCPKLNPLYLSALEIVKTGETSLTEMNRIIY